MVGGQEQKALDEEVEKCGDNGSATWPILLFKRSVLKQRKFQQITNLLQETQGLQCLDIGSDNGLVSYLLRQRGGSWKSADLDDKTVQSIRELVQQGVYQIDGLVTPFRDNEFDRVVIVDFLEHIHTDREFILELFRIMKPNGELIVNVPHLKDSLLRKFRLAIGQTDEKHGHVRPGYTIDELNRIMHPQFSIMTHKTYSKFFSECIDTLITLGLDIVKHDKAPSQKGQVVTRADLSGHRKEFYMYSLLYPVLWFVSRLDTLLFWCSGYMLVAKAMVNKEKKRFSVLQGNLQHTGVGT